MFWPFPPSFYIWPSVVRAAAPPDPSAYVPIKHLSSVRIDCLNSRGQRGSVNQKTATLDATEGMQIAAVFPSDVTPRPALRFHLKSNARLILQPLEELVKMPSVAAVRSSIISVAAATAAVLKYAPLF